MFAKWNFLWSTIPLQFYKSDYGLVTVAWDSSKICFFLLLVLRQFYISYESAFMMSLLWWLKNVWWCVFYDLAAISTACINSMIETLAWNEASFVVSPPVLLICGSITSVLMTYIHAFLLRFALWFSVVVEEYGNTLVQHTVNTVAEQQPGTCWRY